MGRGEGATAASFLAMDPLLQAIALRPGVKETLLIDPQSVVVASGNAAGVVGQ